jgi:threonine dehydratase
MLTLDKIYHAAFVLKDVVRETTLIPSPKISVNNNVYLKTENLQVTGSFKVRGAGYMISQLSEEEKARGVVACSAGNHAQGVALAAQKYGIKATICLPDGAPISKVEATKSYGAEVVMVKGVYDDAYKRALELRDEKGLTFVHPFDDDDVIAGQATIALEILNNMKNIDAIVVPIGGGGLIAGIAYAVKHLAPHIKVYGVQAVGAPSMYNALKNGSIEALTSVSTIADGIAVKQPGDLTYELISKYVDEIAVVSDDEISAAILKLMEKHKLVTEGAGAVAVAAVMFDKFNLEGKKVVSLLSGGNIDVTILSRVISRGLMTSGRRTKFAIEVADKPGELSRVTQIIAKQGANIISSLHERSNGSSITGCNIRVTLETRDFEHVESIQKALQDAGYNILKENNNA